METYAHIVAVGVSDGTYGRKVSEYQITLNAGGTSWARSVESESGLSSFLGTSLALKPEIIDSTLRKLRETGHAMIPDVDLPENEAPALGFQKTPIDF